MTERINPVALDPVAYVRAFCAEIGAPCSSGLVVSPERQRGQSRPKGVLFLRMYRYQGVVFVTRMYQRILDREPTFLELEHASHAQFHRCVSRTELMLRLRYSPAGRKTGGHRMVGLDLLRL